MPHFKVFCSSAEVILTFVYMKLLYPLSYRDLEDMTSMSGISIDHATPSKMGISFFNFDRKTCQPLITFCINSEACLNFKKLRR